MSGLLGDSPQPALHAQAEAIGQELAAELKYSIARTPEDAGEDDWLTALCLVVRRRLVDTLLATQRRHGRQQAKKVYYLSLEFLVGRSLVSNLLALGMLDATRQAMRDMGLDFDGIAEREHDAALGNGGLGRLAACFMESLATLGYPAMGCGIKYDYGLFKQAIVDGEQAELADHWDADRSPWMLERADECCIVPLYGHVEHGHGPGGAYRPRWVPASTLTGVPHDMPIVGYGNRSANVLRLYAARASEVFDMGIFNAGDYVRAVEQKIHSETVSKVLYPSDDVQQGKELRLVQEYFLVACAIHDIVRDLARAGQPVTRLPDMAAIQMNDTHPALAVVELMRVLLDQQALSWDDAWQITFRTCAYTNHTLLPEALEKWPVDLMARVLPRHMELIYEINERFLRQVRREWGPHDPRIASVSLIEEGPVRYVRMANLAIVGSHSVNGVAQLHSRLITTELVPDFHALMPERFNNKTNGITARRWIAQANPDLTGLLDEALGTGWVTDLDRLGGLEPWTADPDFVGRLAQVKLANKRRLAGHVRQRLGIVLDPCSLYDVQIKRIHEYKRQLLHILHVIHLYLRLVEHGQSLPPRTHVFAGKAAPGYAMAKRIIHLINRVADTINRDPRCAGRLAVVFLPDYKVSLAERIIPAADVSEQISTAGMEASGTGNMKLALNGALTVGTLDGANIEIRECVGDDNFYAFGLTSAEVQALRQDGAYRPAQRIEADPDLREVLHSLVDGRFCSDRGAYTALYHELTGRDRYSHVADFASYAAAHRAVQADFADQQAWHRKALLNIARLGRFSSDRTVREYAADIWAIAPA